MNFFSVKMKGEMILSETNDYQDPKFMPDFKEYYSFELKNGSVQPKATGDMAEVHFDVDEYSGFVKGFIYEKDSKFFGKFRYRTDVGNEVQDLNGNYVIQDDILYISGVWYEDNIKWYFFMHLQGPENLPFEKLPVTDQAIEVTKLEASPKSLFADVLNEEKFEKILILSEKGRKSFLKSKFDTNSFLAEQQFRNDKNIDFIKALHLAHVGDFSTPNFKHNIQDEVNKMESDLGLIFNINTKADFAKNYKSIRKILIKYYKLSNSIFITTYSLYLIDPDVVPLYWKEIGKVWNKSFSDDFIRFPQLKLKINVPENSIEQVENFLNYWGLVLEWKELSKVDNLRKISDALYWLT